MKLNNITELFAIEATNLCKSFGGKEVVKNVSLKIRPGEIFGFLGPNGGGKTTTIRMLCGLLTPDCGSGSCFGYDIVTESELIKLNTGYMTQHFSLYDELTVYENLFFIARVYKVNNRESVVKKAITNLGLEKRAHQLAGTLSGGWKQRLSLAAALLHSPKLLLLDEPTAGVDPGARREFWDHIHMLATQGITILVSTHYMDEAERCHRLGYIFNGKILVQGTKKEIIHYAGLNTWEVTGDDLAAIIPYLQNISGVEQVVVFGNSLHVSGKDILAINAGIESEHLRGYQSLQIIPSLEDVFISLGGNNNNNNENFTQN